MRLPRYDDGTISRAFPGLEASAYLYGEFTTNRPLTSEEMESYQIREVDLGSGA